MAYELLQALRIGSPITHGVHHDVESFVWVFIYTISVHDSLKSGVERKITNPKDWKELDESIQFTFGSTGLIKLGAARAHLIMGSSTYFEDGPLRYCAATLLRELEERYSALRHNRDKVEEADYLGIEIGPRGLKAVLHHDHDFAIEIFEKYKRVALTKGQ